MDIKKILSYLKKSQRDLRKIRQNLARVISVAERREYAERIYERLIALLHDVPAEEKKEALRRLRIAAAVKAEYGLLLNDYTLGRLRQFYKTTTYAVMPAEGWVLMKFLFTPPEQNLKEFLRSELAKIKLAESEYLVEVNSLIEEGKVLLTSRKVKGDNGFDPFNPKTWEK